MNSTEYPVQVKLSTVGSEGMQTELKNISNVMGVMQDKLASVTEGARRLSVTFRQADADGNKYSITMRQLKDNMNALGTSTAGAGQFMNDFIARMTGAMAVLGMAQRVFMNAVGALQDFAKSGVELNSLLETSQLGIAATITSYRQYRDEQGNVIKGEAALRMAFSEAANIQKLLQREAFNTTATLEQMLTAYQRLQIGAGSQKTTSQELVHFVGTLGNLARVTGQSFDELASQTQRVLMGVFTIRSPILAILRSMGIDNDTIRSWVRTGEAVHKVNEALNAYAKIGPEINKTWSGVMSNIQDVTQQLSAAGMSSLMESVKTVGNEFVGNFTRTFTEGGVRITEVTEEAKQNARAIGEALRLAFEIGVGAIKGFFSAWRTGSTDFKTTMVTILESMASLKSYAEAIGTAITNMTKTSLIPFMAAMAQRDIAMFNPEGAREKIKWIWETLKADKEMTFNFVENEKKREEALKREKEYIRTSIMTAGPGSADFVGPNPATPGIGEPNPYKMSEAAKETIERWKDFIKTLGSKVETAGLTGLSKSLADNQLHFDQLVQSIDNWRKKLKTLTPDDLRASGLGSVEGALEAAKGRAKEKLERDDSKSIADAEAKYRELYARIGRLSHDSADDQIEDKRRIAQAELVRQATELASFANTEEEMLALIQLFNMKKKQINDQADRERTERFENEMAVLQDQLDAVSRDSYTRERAAVEKSFDAEKKNIEARYGELSERAQKEVALARQVRDAKLALIAEEQASIIGFRRQAEDDAKKIILSTDSIAGGVSLGIAKMKQTIVSTTEAVGDFVAGVWNSLGQAFETGFYDILAGKFENLQEVLKGLWDSILKDFSKMLTQMLMRWLLLGDEMGSGRGGVAGALQGLLGGSNAVYTPGGTANNGSGTVGLNNSGGIPGLQGGAPLRNGQQQGGDLGGYIGLAAGIGTAAYGLYSGVSSLFKPNMTSTPTYQGQSLGQVADFGGPGGGALAAGGLAVAAGTLVAAQAAVTVGLLTAAAASAATVVGLIVAAALLVAAVLVEIFSGKQEGHIYVAMSDAFEKSGARSVIGTFVGQVIDTTANFVGTLALKAAGGEGVQKYMQAYQKAFKDIYGNAKFDFAAGSPEDLQKDIETFFKTTLPTMAMRAAFGQIGFDPNGNRDAVGGMAGMDWNMNNPLFMDQNGNWVKKQLYDPNAPIPMLLTGIGFSADAIGEIAQKLASGVDIEKFKKDLMELVEIVVGFGDLGAQLGRSVSEWRTFFAGQAAQKGTAAEFSGGISFLKGQGLILESLTGDERLAAAKQLLQDSSDLMNKMAQALQSIFDMIDNIQKTTATTIQTYRDKLLKPSELEAAARDRIVGDFSAITDAANPSEVQAAWQTVMKDLSQVLDAIVARMTAIKALQQSYVDFRTQMAKDSSVQFTTDPAGWLAKNQSEIDAVTNALESATGDDAIENARKLLSLTQERYNNELQMLGRVNAAITSIQETHDATNQNLTMQGIGHVEVDPATGKKTWVPDIHAQGDYLKSQYDSLMGQLASAQTPEEVQRIYSKLQNIISQLAAQPQDPARYAESRQILQGMNDASTKTAQDLLKKWGKTLDEDLSGTGSKLKTGETALVTALDAAEKDFEKYLGLMNDASVYATNSLNDFATALVTAMNDISKYVAHWTFVMSHTADEKDPYWDYEKNQPRGSQTVANKPTTVQSRDVWQTDPTDPTMEICVSGPSKGQKRVKPTPGGPGTGTGPDNKPAGGALSLTVTVNSGSAAEIAEAAASAVRTQVYTSLQKNNVELVRVLRNNPSLTSAAY